MMKRWLVRTEEDPTCKCTVEAATREDALAQGADKTGCDADDLLAVESPVEPVDRFTVKVKCGEEVRTARLTNVEWCSLVRYAKTLCLPNNPPAFILVGGIVVWSNEYIHPALAAGKNCDNPDCRKKVAENVCYCSQQCMDVVEPVID